VRVLAGSPSWGVVYPQPSAPFDLHVPPVLPRASYPVSLGSYVAWTRKQTSCYLILPFSTTTYSPVHQTIDLLVYAADTTQATKVLL